MKKALFTLALAGFAFAANAQFILGGEIGLTTTGGTNSYEANSPLNAFDVPNNKSFGLTLAPTISYVINDQMQAGVEISYTMGSTTNYTAAAYAIGKEDWTKTKTSFFGIAPYFRYYFANAGKFNFFCEAQFGFSIMPRDKGHVYNNNLPVTRDEDVTGTTKSTMIALAITPGVNYRISEHFSADLYIDLAGLAFLHTSTKTYGAMTTSGWDDDFLVNTDKTNFFGLTANASAQGINTHLGNFRLGFNYHF